MKRLLLLLLLAGCAAPSAWDAERDGRIRKDYSLTRDELSAQLAKRVRDYRPEELGRWEAEGRLDAREFDGERRYLGCSVSNLFFRYGDVRARRLAGRTWSPLRLETEPVRFRVTMKVTVKPDVVPAGETVRAWLPFPRAYDAQTDIRSAANPPDAPMRAAYFEKRAEAGKPVVFELACEFTRHGVKFDLDPAKARPTTDHPCLREEPPHVVFTPELKALARQVAGSETNPVLKARKLYDWCAANVLYSFAHEYSTIENISEFCYRKRYGDCGQIALLFITLCRIAGVPARWQSGWVIPPGAENMHDWTEIYVEPWGWVPVDPWAPQSLNHADGVSEADKQKIRDFYFGGLDPYRLVANRGHGAPLVPAKRTWRSDTVDFQRGEVEWGRTNVYYDQFDYELKSEIIRNP